MPYTQEVITVTPELLEAEYQRLVAAWPGATGEDLVQILSKDGFSWRKGDALSQCAIGSWSWGLYLFQIALPGSHPALGDGAPVVPVHLSLRVAEPALNPWHASAMIPVLDPDPMTWGLHQRLLDEIGHLRGLARQRHLPQAAREGAPALEV